MRRSPALPLLFVWIALLFTTIGCDFSYQGQSLTSPTTEGAIITGSIISLGTSEATVSSTGASVHAVGSLGATTIDPRQQFVLSSVAPGSNVVLQFTGAGLNAQVPIGLVGNGDRLEIVLVRAENLLRLDQTGRVGSGGLEVEGRIDDIATATGTFLVIGRTIQTDGSTQFIKANGEGGTFRDLAVGFRVKVSGTTTATLMMLAKVVRLEDPQTSITMRLEGPISGLEGTVLSFQFNVQTQLVRGDNGTLFTAPATFATLREGSEIQMTGVTKVGFVLATQIRVK